MGFNTSIFHRLAFLLQLLLLLVPSLALNTDGVLLLSFKYSILSDPLSILRSWNYDDETPCAWNGVTCTELGIPGTPDMFRVTSLVLPNSHLLGSISADLGHIQYLRHLDLSSNLFNGTLPSSIFNSTELQVLSLSGNVISGELPESIGRMVSLQLLNLSDNALAGNVPENLTALQNLTVVSLRSNYFSGRVPSGFNSLEVLDLSSNLLNGSLPLDFDGGNLRYLNLSYNKISGSISPEFAKQLPQNATIDLSFNNLTGAIPESLALLNQKTESFSGNIDLCGKPLKNLCLIPSTLSTPPNVSQSISPAIAVIPKSIDSTPVASSSPGEPNNTQNQARGSLKPGTIAAIAVADLAGISILGMIILYVYQLKKGKDLNQSTTATSNLEKKPDVPVSKAQVESGTMPSCSCIKLKLIETSDTTSSDSDDQEEKNQVINVNPSEAYQKGGKLVTVDGETELELETLLKASAYILGTSGSSIVYKAVLENGTAFAVRRIGESSVERLKDFESQVRIIAKLRHPNLVKIRGFYWGDVEKLVIYDYVSNGSLACSSYRRSGSSSPCHLPLEARVKIARGVARGLAYIHEKKQVHGNFKPSNILLNSNMEPLISDLGLDRLVSGNVSYKPNNSSARFLSSQRSTASRDGPPDPPTSPSSHAPATASSSTGTPTPYQAPESLKNLKPNPKWDVYSFGIILLELLSGRVFSTRELGQWAVPGGSVEEEKNRAVRLADVAIRGDVESREEAMLACFRLGFSCSSFVPQRRPSMKEAVQILEKLPSASSSSSC
ncbi:PREDICTED: receptor protein kinase-like protein At4g34220 [Theobroma cacao]|uniref:Receptor protein kinase-like protein At4g34220 n=1 Tax=Theobroma cacao TaxID=3641 RepID=A0AB32VEV6_THECC|nr:PREDICTED: receptor protein kinase-like protein At4g34220 [Theobroma cacao]